MVVDIVLFERAYYTLRKACATSTGNWMTVNYSSSAPRGIIIDIIIIIIYPNSLPREG